MAMILSSDSEGRCCPEFGTTISVNAREEEDVPFVQAAKCVRVYRSVYSEPLCQSLQFSVAAVLDPQSCSEAYAGDNDSYRSG